MRRTLFSVIILSLYSIFAVPIASEIIVLKSGELIDGIIRYEDDRALAIEVDGELRLIQRSEIDQILYENRGQNAADAENRSGAPDGPGSDTNRGQSQSAVQNDFAPFSRPALAIRSGGWFGRESGDFEDRLRADGLVASGAPNLSTDWSDESPLASPVGFSFFLPTGAGEWEFSLDVFGTNATYGNNLVALDASTVGLQEIAYTRGQTEVLAAYRIALFGGRLNLAPGAGIASFFQTTRRELRTFSAESFLRTEESRSARAVGLALAIEAELRFTKRLSLIADHLSVPGSVGSATGESLTFGSVIGDSTRNTALLGESGGRLRWSADRTSIGMRYRFAPWLWISAGWRQSVQRTRFPGYRDITAGIANGQAPELFLDPLELLSDALIYSGNGENRKGLVFLEASFFLNL